MSTKGSCANIVVNPSREKPHSNIRPTIGLYVNDDHSTCLVTLGKVYEGASTIHHMHLTDDVVKVVVEEV